MTQGILAGLTIEELKEYRKKLQNALLSGVRQASFAGQTVIFKSSTEITNELNRVADALVELEGGRPVKRTKRIILSARRGRGFL